MNKRIQLPLDLSLQLDVEFDHEMTSANNYNNNNNISINNNNSNNVMMDSPKINTRRIPSRILDTSFQIESSRSRTTLDFAHDMNR